MTPSVASVRLSNEPAMRDANERPHSVSSGNCIRIASLAMAPAL